MNSKTHRQARGKTYSTGVPCECGNPNGGWWGPRDGLREYYCGPCWHAKQLANACQELIASVEGLLPGAAHIVCDIGQINHALIDSREALKNWKSS